jgi:diadenosine tetraphosphate (Ap4A) HIT family hydrolase
VTTESAHCELCDGDGGRIVVATALLRVVRVDEPDYPGFCRVLKRHVREMTDCSAEESSAVWRAVLAVEAALRATLEPDKINLASLGNVTPHVHWHVIPRWKDDARFPQPIWGSPIRSGARSSRDDALLTLDQRIRAALS